MKIKIILSALFAMTISLAMGQTQFNSYGVQKYPTGDSLRIVGSGAGQYLILPTTALVKRLIANSSPVYTANNGITKIGNNFSLGGDANWNYTNGVTIGSGLSGVGSLGLSPFYSTLGISATGGGGFSLLNEKTNSVWGYQNNNSKNSNISISPTQMLVTDQVNNRGFLYADKYRSNLTNRWIPDKEYVDSVSLLSSVTAGYGLAKTANEIRVDTLNSIVSKPYLVNRLATSQTIGANTTGNSATTSAVSGTVNYIPKFTASGIIGNSVITDNGTSVSIPTSLTIASSGNTGEKLLVNGGITIKGAINATGNNLNTGNNITSYNEISASNGAFSSAGLFNNAYHYGGNSYQLSGIINQVNAWGELGSTLGRAIGSSINLDFNFLKGTIQNAYGSFITQSGDSMMGSIGNLYGMYVGPMTFGQNNYAIYTDGSTKSYFGGNVSINTLTGTGDRAVFAGADGTLKIGSSGSKQVRTASGSGVATTISIAHGLTSVTSSSYVSAIANNAASAGIQYVTVDATSVNIFYTVAPAIGTNNLTYSIEIKP